MARALQERGYKIVSGGTDNHLFLLDLVDKDITGKDADAALGRAHITVNKNAVPNDPRPPHGHQRPPHRHAGRDDARLQGERGQSSSLAGSPMCSIACGDESTVERVRGEVAALCRRFPVYG